MFQGSKHHGPSVAAAGLYRCIAFVKITNFWPNYIDRECVHIKVEVRLLHVDRIIRSGLVEFFPAESTRCADELLFVPAADYKYPLIGPKLCGSLRDSIEHFLARGNAVNT